MLIKTYIFFHREGKGIGYRKQLIGGYVIVCLLHERSRGVRLTRGNSAVYYVVIITRNFIEGSLIEFTVSEL